MAHLDLPLDHVRTAADAWAAAIAVHRRRVAAYERLSAAPPPTEEREQPERLASEEPMRRSVSIAAELARQLGVPTIEIKKETGRGLAWVAFRQLGMALTARLTKLSLKQIGRVYGGYVIRPLSSQSGQWRLSSMPPVSTRRRRSSSGFQKRCLFCLLPLPRSAQRTGHMAPQCTTPTANSHTSAGGAKRQMAVDGPAEWRVKKSRPGANRSGYSR
jgi:hypothetical protein